MKIRTAKPDDVRSVLSNDYGFEVQVRLASEGGFSQKQIEELIADMIDAVRASEVHAESALFVLRRSLLTELCTVLGISADTTTETIVARVRDLVETSERATALNYRAEIAEATLRGATAMVVDVVRELAAGRRS